MDQAHLMHRRFTVAGDWDELLDLAPVGDSEECNDQQLDFTCYPPRHGSEYPKEKEKSSHSRQPSTSENKRSWTVRSDSCRSLSFRSIIYGATPLKKGAMSFVLEDPLRHHKLVPGTDIRKWFATVNRGTCRQVREAGEGGFVAPKHHQHGNYEDTDALLVTFLRSLFLRVCYQCVLPCESRLLRAGRIVAHRPS
jgi:hypothetical protein